MMRWLGFALVAAAPVLAPAAGAQDSDIYQEGFNRTSAHYDQVEKGHPRRCQDACLGDSRCFAWAYNKNGDVCRLMEQSPPAPPQKDQCCVTGIRQN